MSVGELRLQLVALGADRQDQMIVFSNMMLTDEVRVLVEIEQVFADAEKGVVVLGAADEPLTTSTQ